MFREENQNIANESTPQITPKPEKQEKPDSQNPRVMYRESGGGQRGAKYRMFLADGFEEDAAWYFSGPEYREKMKRYDDETRLGMKYCQTCDQVMPEPGEEIRLDENTEKEIDGLIAEFRASEPRTSGLWIFNMYLNEGFSIEQAMYLIGPERKAELHRRKAEEQLGIMRCRECYRYLPQSGS